MHLKTQILGKLENRSTQAFKLTQKESNTKEHFAKLHVRIFKVTLSSITGIESIFGQIIAGLMPRVTWNQLADSEQAGA